MPLRDLPSMNQTQTWILGRGTLLVPLWHYPPLHPSKAISNHAKELLLRERGWGAACRARLVGSGRIKCLPIHGFSLADHPSQQRDHKEQYRPSLLESWVQFPGYQLPWEASCILCQYVWVVPRSNVVVLMMSYAPPQCPHPSTLPLVAKFSLATLPLRSRRTGPRLQNHSMVYLCHNMYGMGLCTCQAWETNFHWNQRSDVWVLAVEKCISRLPVLWLQSKLSFSLKSCPLVSAGTTHIPSVPQALPDQNVFCQFPKDHWAWHPAQGEGWIP